MGIYALELDAYTAPSTVTTFYFATQTLSTSPTDTPANTIYRGRMKNAGELKRSLFENGGVIGKPGFNHGYFEFDNADGGLDAFLDYGIDGRQLVLKYIDDPTSPTAVADAVTVMTCIMRGFDSLNLTTALRILVRDGLEALNRPVLTTFYDGSTTSSAATAEGDDTIAGRAKPQSWGAPALVEPVLANKFDLIYQIGVNPQLASTIGIMDGNPVVAPTLDADHATIAALRSAVIAAGHYATCVAQGLFRLGAAAAFRIVAVSKTDTLSKAGQVTKDFLLYNGVSSGEMVGSSFDDVTSFSSWLTGIWINDTSTTVLDAACLMLNSAGATLTTTSDGLIQAIIFGDGLDGAPDETFTQEDIDAGNANFVLQSSLAGEGDGVPIGVIDLKYSRYYTTLSRGDLTTGVAQEYVADFGKEWRHSNSRDFNDVTVKHPLAATLEIETQIIGKSNAFTEAQRRYDLYSPRRDFVTVTVSASRAGSINLGDIVAIDIDRFGYDGGKNFVVVQRHDQFTTGRVTFNLWG